MAFITLEDFSGRGDCIVFSDAYRQFQNILNPESMIMAIGKAEQNGDMLRIIVKEVYPMEKVREKFAKSIMISIDLGRVREHAIAELRRTAERFRGKCCCYFTVLPHEKQSPVHFQATKLLVEPSDQFITEVENILGPNCIKFLN